MKVGPIGSPSHFVSGWASGSYFDTAVYNQSQSSPYISALPSSHVKVQPTYHLARTTKTSDMFAYTCDFTNIFPPIFCFGFCIILFRRLYITVNRTIHIHISLPPTPILIGDKNGHALIDNGNPLEELKHGLKIPLVALSTPISSVIFFATWVHDHRDLTFLDMYVLQTGSKRKPGMSLKPLRGILGAIATDTKKSNELATASGRMP